MLDTSSPIPLYYQLKATIEDHIQSGHWKPGDRLPSESQLGQQFQISRTTIRQALGDLVNQGLLVRIQGKGTFVAEPRIQQRLARLTGFTQDMRARGQKAASQVLQLDVIPAPPQVGKPLQLSLDETVIVLKRLRLADGTPMAVETAYLVYRLCKDLLNEDLAIYSLYSLLAQKLNLTPARAVQQLEATACPSLEARLLGIPKASPVLHIHRTTFDQHGQPFEQVESFYRGDRYVFQAELSSEMLSG